MMAGKLAEMEGLTYTAWSAMMSGGVISRDVKGCKEDMDMPLKTAQS